jgi:hypothetical protein
MGSWNLESNGEPEKMAAKTRKAQEILARTMLVASSPNLRQTGVGALILEL